MHLLMVADDPRLADPGSDVFARHAGYAARMAARRPGASLSVLVPGIQGAHAAADLSVAGRLPRQRPDAVTAQSPWSRPAWRIALTHGIPFLAQLHFDPFAPSPAAFSDRARARLAWLASRRAARVRVMAPATAQAVTAQWAIPADRVWLAPVPIVWPDLPAAAREALVVGAMRLAPDRAPHRWIEACRKIAAARPDLRFVLAGDGPLLPVLRAAAHGLPLALPGTLGSTALAQLLARARLFLHTAPHEAFGRAMAEAQAAGLPVVARVTTGAAHVVRDGKTGLLRASIDDLAEAACALLADPVRLRVMGAAARTHAARAFDPVAMQERVVDFLLGERRVAEAACATC